MGCHEDRRHFGPLQVSSGEDEHAHGGQADRGQSGASIPYPTILGENDPTPLASRSQSSSKASGAK